MACRQRRSWQVLLGLGVCVLVSAAMYLDPGPVPGFLSVVQDLLSASSPGNAGPSNARDDDDDVILEDVTDVLSERNVRIATRGVPLLDTWRDHALYNLSTAQVNELLNALGDFRQPCDRQTLVRQVRVRFSPSGFGSNLNQVLYATLFALVKRRKVMLLDSPNQLQAEFHASFSYAVKGETLCPGATPLRDSCPIVREECKHYSAFVASAQDFFKKKTKYYIAIKIILWRLLTRVTPAMREEIDAVVREEGVGDLASQSHGTTSTLAVHIRGTDTPRSLRERVLPEQWEDAVVHAVRKWPFDSPPGNQSRTIVIVTDDEEAARHVLTALQRNPLFSGNTRFVFRATRLRPDKVRENKVHESTVQMMADLKILAMADTFVGTMSSNFGDIACYLRAEVRCVDAENPGESFTWNHAHVKFFTG